MRISHVASVALIRVSADIKSMIVFGGTSVPLPFTIRQSGCTWRHTSDRFRVAWISGHCMKNIALRVMTSVCITLWSWRMIGRSGWKKTIFSYAAGARMH